MLLACARAPETPPPKVAIATPSKLAIVEPAVVAAEEALELEGEAGPLARPRDPRRVGDVFVHRFERKGKPDLFLTERVESLDDDEFEESLSLRGPEREEEIVLRRSSRSERLLSVHKADRSRTRLDLDAYRRFLERTAFAVGENAGLVRRDEGTCLVAEREDRCERSEYRVYVDGGEATMRVASSAALSRDVLEEVVDSTGAVLYRAELVDVSRGPETEASTARAESTRLFTIREDLRRSERPLFD